MIPERKWRRLEELLPHVVGIGSDCERIVGARRERGFAIQRAVAILNDPKLEVGGLLEPEEELRMITTPLHIRRSDQGAADGEGVLYEFTSRVQVFETPHGHSAKVR